MPSAKASSRAPAQRAKPSPPPTTGADTPRDRASLLRRLVALRRRCTAMERQHARELRATSATPPAPEAIASTKNLLHYLALRQSDLRPLQTPLAELGLSSLGRIESHVLANLNAAIAALGLLARGPSPRDRPPAAPITLRAAQALIDRRADALLGPARAPVAGGPRWGDRIMVTLPTAAADDRELIRSLLHAGMTVARINTAHDTPDHWERMSRLVRAEAQRSGLACRVLLDLAGPKLRTGPIEPGPSVVRFKPRRDALGRVLVPASIPLRPLSSPPPTPGAEPGLPLPDDWLARLRPGDTLHLTDARGRQRVLRLAAPARRPSTSLPAPLLATCDRTVYITPGTRLRLRPARGRARPSHVAAVGHIPPVEQSIVVRPGDRLRLALRGTRGRPLPATRGRCAGVLTCTLPEAFARVSVGDPVWIDDGKIGARVETISASSVELLVTVARREGDRIRADRGINLPQTDIPVDSLTARDIEVLPLAVRHADLVGMSFVRTAADVVELRQRLTRAGGGHLGVVLKIETRRAFENLPGLLLNALRGPGVGVMIARGDLAVELGYHRLAEVQEEILWLCEAAHVPVIWATQVLEKLAKTGQPSRAEVTDAAVAQRAECVMLNKGPHIVEAVEFLAELLGRMRDHQSKKRTMLRALSVARRFGRSG